MRHQAICGVVSGDGGEIEASVGAVLECFDYSDEPHLTVKWFGVAPAFRKTDRAARLMTYTRWLFDTMSAASDLPVPVFLSSMTTLAQERKLRLFQRRLPTVGALFALGCLPEAQFFTTHAGRRRNGTKDRIEGPPRAKPSASPIASVLG
jgi:hypothetical protein